MDTPMKKFNDLINYSNNCKGNTKIYMFLKDCAFRSVFNFFQSGNVNPQDKQNIQNLYSQFQTEVSQFNWNFKLILNKILFNVRIKECIIKNIKKLYYKETN